METIGGNVKYAGVTISKKKTRFQKDNEDNKNKE